MSVEHAIEILRETFLLALYISGPILIAGLLIGLLVSILQTVTQIQEQTLTFVPKIVGMTLVVILIAPWIGIRMLEFAERMFRP